MIKVRVVRSETAMTDVLREVSDFVNLVSHVIQNTCLFFQVMLKFSGKVVESAICRTYYTFINTLTILRTLKCS
jgi:hypothetical protein